MADDRTFHQRLATDEGCGEVVVVRAAVAAWVVVHQSSRNCKKKRSWNQRSLALYALMCERTNSSANH